MNSPIEGLEVVLATEDTETPAKRTHAGHSTASGNVRSIMLYRWHDSRECLLWRVQLQWMPNVQCNFRNSNREKYNDNSCVGESLFLEFSYPENCFNFLHIERFHILRVRI